MANLAITLIDLVFGVGGLTLSYLAGTEREWGPTTELPPRSVCGLSFRRAHEKRDVLHFIKDSAL